MAVQIVSDGFWQFIIKKKQTLEFINLINVFGYIEHYKIILMNHI